MADKEAAREELSKFKRRINKIFNMKDTKARSAAVLEVLEEYRSGGLDYLFVDNTHTKEFVKSVMKELQITPSAIHATAKTSDDVKNKVTDPKFKSSIVDNIMKALLNATNVPGDRNLSNVEIVVNGITGAVINGDSAGLQKTVEDFINNPDNNVKQMKAFQKELANITPMIKNISEALSLALETATQTLQNKIESGFYRQGPIAERVSKVTGKVKDTLKRVFYKADPVQETETPCTALVPVDMHATPAEIEDLNKEENVDEAESTALVPAGETGLSTDVKVPIDLEAIFGDENGRATKKGGFKRFFDNARAYVAGKYAQFLEFLDKSVEKVKEWFENRKKQQEDPTVTEETALEVLQVIGEVQIFDKDKNWLMASEIPACMDIRSKEHWSTIKESMDPEGTYFKKGNIILVSDGHTAYRLDPETFELTDLSKNMGRQEGGQALLTDGTEPQVIEAEFEVIDENNKKTKFKLSEFLDKFGDKFKKVWEQLKAKWENRKTRNKEKAAEIDEDHMLPPGKEEGQTGEDTSTVEENENEDDGKKPRKSLKERLGDLKKGAQDKFSKLGEKFKKRTKEERESFKADSYLDSINNYLAKIEEYRDKEFDNFAQFIKGADLEDKKFNNLKSLLINAKSVIDAYLARVEKANVTYGKYPPAEAILSAIKIECERIHYNEATKVDTLENVDVTKGQNNIVANVEAIRKQIEEYDADYDDKRKAKFLFEECLTRAGYDPNNPEETAKNFKKWFGIKPDMSMSDMLTKIQEFGATPKAFAKDKEGVDLYRGPVKAFKEFYAQSAPGIEQANNVKMMSEAEFISKYARGLALVAVRDFYSLEVGIAEHRIQPVVDKTYRSIKLDNRKLLKNVVANAEAYMARLTTEAVGYLDEFKNSIIQGHDGLVTPTESGGVKINVTQLPKDVLEKIKEEALAILDQITLDNGAKERFEGRFSHLLAEFDHEQGEEEQEVVEPVEVNPTELADDAINGFTDFIKDKDDKEKIVASYIDPYSMGIAEGLSLHNIANDPKAQPLIDLLVDKNKTVQQKIEEIQKDQSLVDILKESFKEGSDKTFDDFVKSVVENGGKLFTAKPAMESLIAEYEETTGKSVGDTALFAKKYACLQQIMAITKDKEFNSETDQHIILPFYKEYYDILNEQVKKNIPLTKEEEQFVKDFESNKSKVPTQEGAIDFTTYDLTNFETDYAEWKKLADLKTKGEKLTKEQKDKMETIESQYVKEIVKKVILFGDKYKENPDKKTIESAQNELLTDNERAFLGANAAKIPALCKGELNNAAKHNAFCQGVMAHKVAGKTIPNVVASLEPIKDENGNEVGQQYVYNTLEGKTYDELFPSTDISSKIAKTVKDLKDAYVYLKPGIKLCDKLIDYIKGLTFNVESGQITPPTGTDGKGDKEGEEKKDPITPPAPTDDNAKILALLKEITDKLVDLEKAVKLATNGIESSKIDAMQKSGDVQGKLFEAFKLINKEGQDPKITQAHTPAYNQCYAAYDGLIRQLMGMGQMQIPVQPIGNGMYAIPGNMLGFMAAANYQMYGAAFANFMGLDPQMYSKMYAQMRPSYTTSITIVTNQGVKVDLKVKLAAGLVNDSQVNLFKKDIHDHVYNFIETSSTDLNAIRGDLMAYLEELLPGSTIESTSLTNVKTGEKQEITTEELEADGDVKGKVDPKKAPVKPAAANEKEHAPKPRFDFVIDDKTATLSVLENGNVVASKVLDKKLTPAEKAYLRSELNEIERAEFKSPQEEQFFFNSMFDKLLEKDAGLEQ